LGHDLIGGVEMPEPFFDHFRTSRFDENRIQRLVLQLKMKMLSYVLLMTSVTAMLAYSVNRPISQTNAAQRSSITAMRVNSNDYINSLGTNSSDSNDNNPQLNEQMVVSLSRKFCTIF
jgi:hypothetical protein